MIYITVILTLTNITILSGTQHSITHITHQIYAVLAHTHTINVSTLTHTHTHTQHTVNQCISITQI